MNTEEINIPVEEVIEITPVTEETPIEVVVESTPETPIEVTAPVAEAIARDYVAACYNQSGEFVQGFQNLEEAYAFAGENGYQVSIK